MSTRLRHCASLTSPLLETAMFHMMSEVTSDSEVFLGIQHIISFIYTRKRAALTMSVAMSLELIGVPYGITRRHSATAARGRSEPFYLLSCSRNNHLSTRRCQRGVLLISPDQDLPRTRLFYRTAAWYTAWTRDPRTLNAMISVDWGWENGDDAFDDLVQSSPSLMGRYLDSTHLHLSTMLLSHKLSVPLGYEPYRFLSGST
ncbi:hypothetical protein BJY00DRAFT_192671 [Aspergillus carlsbadensis]|nr:hypothetical protein BJY00DRAFT_192671 [Aspergillus carlsbadensis]